MKQMLTAAFFTANRAALRKQTNSDQPIILAANGLLQRTADSTFPFQQDSNFWYLTGLDEPDLLLVMAGSSEYIIAPLRNATRQAFDGTIDLEALKRQSGITDTVGEREGWEWLRALLAKAGRAQICSAAATYDKQHGMWANPASHRLHQKLKRLQPGISLQSLDSTLAALRVKKQPLELRALQAAIDITSQTIADVRHNLESYSREYEIEAAISQGFRSRGASGHSFSPIVAGGAHATVLHNVANNGRLGVGDLIVLDIGAEVEHYAADITRTVSLQEPSKRQREVYQAVLDTQNYALSLLKPGVLPRDYERRVAQYIGKHLQRLGLVTHIDYESVRRYYPHATSHFLGLDVHDVGDYSQPFEAGMVLTCEPGIYIPEEGIGIRIEDDILLTKTGNQMLSSACPSTLFTVQ